MSKRHAKKFEAEELSEVNVTPLADVSLTLVIMIMIISPMVFQSMIQVQASQAVSANTEVREKENPLYVDVTPKGFYLNSKRYSNEYTLFRNLQKTLNRKRDKTVLISSTENVEYQKVIRVMDIVKQSGARSLSLVPRAKKS